MTRFSKAAVLVMGSLAWTSLASVSVEAQTSYQTLNYLYSMKGQKTLAGQHNKEPNSNPSQFTAQAFAVTGDYPALYSGDFLFAAADVSNRGTMINQALTEWNNGAVINLMWHACSPAVAEPCAWDGGVWTTLNDTQWNQLVTNGTALNNTWKARMDAVAVHLQTLKNAGVEVLFRPLHEMNQPGFWWAGRTGTNGTAKLYQITHDYLRNTKGLTNLIWVWDLQDYANFQSQAGAPGAGSYNPGSSYWDVFALDVYATDGTRFSSSKYNAAVSVAGGKPVAIGECDVLPTPAELAAQPQWAFFMGWAELTFSMNTSAQIQTLYWDGRVVVLDEKPRWGEVNTGYWYSFNNKNSVKCVDVQAAGTVNGTKVQQYTCNQGNAQQFQFQATTGGYYRLNSRLNTAQVIDITGGSSATGDGVKTQLWSYSGGTNQQWLPVSEGGGWYHFVARHSGKCLDVPGASTADGVQLQQWTCNGGAAQSFSLVSH